MSPSSNAKASARELARTWALKPNVFRHWDESERHYIDIASGENSPIQGRVAVGTLGLSDHDLGFGSLRVELVGAFPTSFTEGPNVVATCAFNAFKDGFPTHPDAVHENVIGLYRPSGTLSHVLLTDPFMWADGPKTLDDAGLKIAWLMIVPITESERVFAHINGPDALTTLFEQHQIDVTDLDRNAVA